MKYETIKMLEYVYDNVVCPVCGSKPEYLPTGGDSYKQISCGHPEVEQIIKQREDDYFAVNQQPPRTVRLKL
jgi:DNA-directed RNA polymerase subunit RPC12/RpoP